MAVKEKRYTVGANYITSVMTAYFENGLESSVYV